MDRACPLPDIIVSQRSSVQARLCCWSPSCIRAERAARRLSLARNRRAGRRSLYSRRAIPTCDRIPAAPHASCPCELRALSSQDETNAEATMSIIDEAVAANRNYAKKHDPTLAKPPAPKIAVV